MGNSASKSITTPNPVSTPVGPLWNLPDDILLRIIGILGGLTFPPLIFTCKKFIGLSKKLAWRIMIPSFPIRPPKACLEFAVQNGRNLGLFPLLVSLAFMNDCPNDCWVNALIINSLDKVPDRYFETSTTIAMHSHSDFSLPLEKEAKQVTVEIHEGFVRNSLGRRLEKLKSLMLKNIGVSRGTLEFLNGLTMNELHFNLCYFDSKLMNTPGNIFDFKSVTQLHIEVDGFFMINSSYVFKNLKRLIIHHHCSNPREGVPQPLAIHATDFQVLDYL
jgi:hypothetical protein